MRFDVLTTFPEMFAAAPGTVLGTSIPARCAAAGVAEYHAHNLRDYTPPSDRHQKTDDRPFGGGPGMVMLCQPIWDAVHAVEALDPRPATRIVLSPQGRLLDQPLVEDLATRPRLLLIAGHYEGIDERVIEKLGALEVSIGDYVLSAGELAALVLIDAVVRLLPGALGDEASSAQDSFSAVALPQGLKKKDPLRTLDGTRLLDCPHYTRPRDWMGMSVPEVLMSGDHAAVDRWRLEQRLERTRARRPDLLRGLSGPAATLAPPTGGAEQTGNGPAGLEGPRGRA
jgi:tRNA (guanine37-N1)-methyltransferase